MRLKLMTFVRTWESSQVVEVDTFLPSLVNRTAFICLARLNVVTCFKTITKDMKWLSVCQEHGFLSFGHTLTWCLTAVLGHRGIEVWVVQTSYHRGLISRFVYTLDIANEKSRIFELYQISHFSVKIDLGTRLVIYLLSPGLSVWRLVPRVLWFDVFKT